MDSMMWHSNWDDQSNVNMWQNRSSVTSDINMWSSKTESIVETDKNMYIKSIWSTSGDFSDGDNSVIAASTSIADIDNHITPTNSPSMKREEIVLNNDRWGNVKINQTVAWDLGEMDNDELDKRTADPMVWRANIDGTEVWEDYYACQHGKRRPQSETNYPTDKWGVMNNEVTPPNPLWANKPMDNVCDVFGPNPMGLSTVGMNQQQIFTPPSNGVRPNMTRQQAQKYLTEMGYSLSDAIGALVRNQMDLSKALIDLQKQHRNIKPNSLLTAQSNNSSNSFAFPQNDRMTPSILSNNQSNSFGSNYSSNIDLFNTPEPSPDQLMDPKYFMMEQTSRLPSSNTGPNNIINNNNNNNNPVASSFQPGRMPPIQQMSFPPQSNMSRPITSANPMMVNDLNSPNAGSTINSGPNNNNNNPGASSMNYLTQNMARMNFGGGATNSPMNNNNNGPNISNNSVFNMRGPNNSSNNNNNNSGHVNSNMSNNSNNPMLNNFPLQPFGRSLAPSQQSMKSPMVPTQQQPSNQQLFMGANQNPFHVSGQQQQQQQQMQFARSNSLINWPQQPHDSSCNSLNNSFDSSINNNNININNSINNNNNSQNHNRLAKSSILSSPNANYQQNLGLNHSSYSDNGASQKMICIAIRSIPQSHQEYLHRLFREHLIYPTNCQYVPTNQSLLCQFSSQQDVLRCFQVIKQKLPNNRIDIINNNVSNSGVMSQHDDLMSSASSAAVPSSVTTTTIPSYYSSPGAQ